MNSFSINLQKSFYGECLFCRKRTLKRQFHYCEEKNCCMGEMCIECAKEHKKNHDIKKEPAIALVDSICNPTYKPIKTGNSTGLF
tara:strand:- start:274 stop:528 length:255 start_codon:yes stop_codon:yes gene_type:complete